MIVAFFAFLPDGFNDAINLGSKLFGEIKDGKVIWEPDEDYGAKIRSVVMFGILAVIALFVGSRKSAKE